MFDAEFPYNLSHFEPLHLSVSTLVVFWVLEQKKQLPDRDLGRHHLQHTRIPC